MEPFPPVNTVIGALLARGIALPAGKVIVSGYGDSAEQSRELLALIACGQKRAGTGLLFAYEADDDAIPEVGDIEVVMDHQNEPALITRVTRTEIVPFHAVSAEYAAIEGEGDGSLQFWREAHRAFFTRDCERRGIQFHEDMRVVCTCFDLLLVVPHEQR